MTYRELMAYTSEWERKIRWSGFLWGFLFGFIFWAAMIYIGFSAYHYW